MKYCPRCRTEYENSANFCSDCGAALVSERPPGAEIAYEQGVTVFESSDPGLLILARNTLEEAGIPVFGRGQSVQDLFGAGLGTDFDAFTGLVALQTPPEDADRARELLRAIEEAPDEENEAP